MQSPFPGMDPYLEEPGLWPDVHHGLISETQAILTRQLRPKYYVNVEERIYVSDENDPGRSVIVPDLRVADRPEYSGGAFQPNGETALAVAEPLVLTTLIEDEIHEARLEVIDREQRRVVTVLELTSPTNKVPGSSGQKSYQQKRQEIMDSSSHWVEIDLLRAGVPLYARETVPPCDYVIHVSRKGHRPKGYVWPIRLPQRLPVIPVPLLPEDSDAKLDLQSVLAGAYERSGYDLKIKYGADAVPPLTGDNAAWADQLLRNKGLR